jgi:hypothetical protein
MAPYGPDDKGEIAKVSFTPSERLGLSNEASWVWSAPWITAIAVLGKGIIRLLNLRLPGFSIAFYGLWHDPATDGGDDTVGEFRRILLRNLMNGRRAEGEISVNLVEMQKKPDPKKVIRGMIVPHTEQAATALEDRNSSYKIHRPYGPHVWTIEEARTKFKDQQEKKKKIQQAIKELADEI